jgi:type IX secretion system PorP/SprF family membrane protein
VRVITHMGFQRLFLFIIFEIKIINLNTYYKIFLFQLLLILLFSQVLKSQQSSIIFSKVNFSIHNPAFTGVEGASLIINSRLQWTGIDQAPRTNYLLYHLPQRKNVLLGVSAINDRVFIENKTYLTLDYNYKLQIDQEKSIFLGIKAGGLYNNIDTDKIPRIFNEANPLLSAVESYFNPIIGVGFTMIAPNFFIGLGTPNLFNSKRFKQIEELEPSAQDLTLYHLTGGLKFTLNSKLSLNPSIIYRSISDSPNFISGNISFSYDEKFSIGTGVSNNDNLSVFFNSEGKNGFQWGYGYEFLNGSAAEAIKSPTHEIFLKINLDNKEDSDQNESEIKDEE